MKKQKNYAGLAFLIVLIMAALPSVGPWAWDKMFQKPGEGIIKSNTDEGGLTSVQYVQDGKTIN